MIWNPFNKPPKNKTKEATKDIRNFAAAFLAALGACERVEASDQLPEKSTPVEWVEFLAKKSSVEGDSFESHLVSICNIKNMDCKTFSAKGNNNSVSVDVASKNVRSALEKKSDLRATDRGDLILFDVHNHPFRVIDRIKEQLNVNNVKFPERVLSGPSGSVDCLIPSKYMPLDGIQIPEEVSLVVDPAGVWVCRSVERQNLYTALFLNGRVNNIRENLFIASQSKQGKELEEAIKTFESEFYRLLKVKVKFMNFGFTNQELVDTALEVLK